MKAGREKIEVKVILLSFLIIAVLFCSANFISATSAGKGLVPETVITGKVYYAENGNPVVGADVVVKCGLVNYMNTKTLADGTYYFDLLKKQCKNNDKATVTATENGISAHTTKTITGKNTVIDIPFGDKVDGTMITGVIYDSNFKNTISGAEVTVTCNGNVLTTTSLADGTYFVTYNKGKCEEESMAMVMAAKGDLTGSNEGVVHEGSIGSLDVAVVNVPLVPEFGFVAGTLTVLGAVGTFFVIRKKQHIRIKRK